MRGFRICRQVVDILRQVLLQTAGMSHNNRLRGRGLKGRRRVMKGRLGCCAAQVESGVSAAA
jgi:hypothetical protein